MQILEKHACAGGTQWVLEHESSSTGTTMRLGLFLPESPKSLLVFLSGLTCTEQNVITKGCFQAAATATSTAVLCPDTSPRGAGVPNDDGYDMGQGASFYLDATEAPWSQHFQMRTYIIDELSPLVQRHYDLEGPVGITGHSMGGHGALVLGLSNPDVFDSISAISPIASATRCPWGEKVLRLYLGDHAAAHRDQDASLLLAEKGWRGPILVDQGLDDGFLEEQLKTEFLEDAAKTAGVALNVRRHPGYDHSYYFIGTVLADHVRFHAAERDAD
jgi:S-formylglutathione hydrolase